MIIIQLLILFGFFCTPCVAGDCACATYELHVRNGAGTSHSLLGSMHASDCVPYKGQQQTAEGYTWAHIDFNGQSGWAATNWLSIGPCGTGTGSSNQQLPGCPRIISRSEWGARPPTHTIGHLPAVPKYVFVHHGATPGCTTESACKQKVREYQNYHLDGHHWPDIGYTFVIGEDGNVYEARGWDIIGAHTYNYNYNGLGFCIIGDFTSRLPNTAAINAVKQLINCGVQNGKISANYILRGHRDVNQTACPGAKLEELIKTWPHY